MSHKNYLKEALLTLETFVPSPSEWDTFVAANNGHILQTAKWGKLKAAFGWRDQVVAIAEDSVIRAGALILYKPLPFHLPGNLAYIPRGPVVDWTNQHRVNALLDRINAAAKAKGAFALKIEPD